ncbi:hypothetical protein MOB44_19985 [Bacillus sonorensis]|uniref:hypothetical protein n=1 Tax=Bacillus sonorensis TaxID=119858 RepID=UPI00227F635B|nr:hypothetical protein [Bacillus sonorensis]MCY7858908.1 hypothetical protein [Bacillus sonorensis]
MSSRSVYGTIILTVSRKTAASSKGLAILDSYYAISDDRVDLTELTLLHKNGKVLGTVTVHNVNISWNGFLKGSVKK